MVSESVKKKRSSTDYRIHKIIPSNRNLTNLLEPLECARLALRIDAIVRRELGKLARLPLGSNLGGPLRGLDGALGELRALRIGKAADPAAAVFVVCSKCVYKKK